MPALTEQSARSRDIPVYQLLAEDLAHFGVETCFYLMSDDTIGLCVAIDATGIRLIAPRHETNTVLAAEGYAAATGKLGVAVIGRGPAMANGMHGIMVAARSGSPVLIITGDAEPGAGDNAVGPDYKAYNVQGIMGAAGVATFAVSSKETARATLASAVSAALRGAAVVLHVPASIQNAQIEVVGPPPSVPGRAAADRARPASIAAAAAVLAASRRPLILAGQGAYRSGAGPAIEALAERLGALLVTSFKGKDLFRGNPYNLGICGSFSHSLARKYMAQADAVLVFGASLNFYTTSKGKALPDAPIIQVDAARASIGRWSAADLAIVGDARSVADQLAHALPARDASEKPFHKKDVLDDIAGFDISKDFIPANTSRTLDPRALALRLEDILPANRNLVYDAGNFIMVASYLSVAGPGHIKVSSDFASMGAGFGTALGFAVARPDETNVLVIGDGGFIMTLSELETVARSGIRMVIVVVNDCAYGAELQFCRHRNLPEATSVFADVDFAQIAEALGFRAFTIRTLQDLDALASQIEDWSEPILLDCKVNANVQAPFIGELIGDGH